MGTVGQLVVFKGLGQVMIENEDVELNQYGDSSEEMSSDDGYMYRVPCKAEKTWP